MAGYLGALDFLGDSKMNLGHWGSTVNIAVKLLKLKLRLDL